MKVQTLKIKDLKINVYSLLNIRLWYYSIAFVQLVVTAIVGLNIDLTVDEDPMVRVYSRLRWKLLTCLFNLVWLGYVPLCLYCDWWEKRGDEPRHVEHLRVLRDVVMTSILVPVTTICDIMFWILFTMNPSLIATPRVFDYMPNWIQHSLHTVSMVNLIMDLLLTPRWRPDSMKPRLAVTATIAIGYIAVVHVNVLNGGEPVYAFMATASNTLLYAVYFGFFVTLNIFFYAQWPLIEYIWGHNRIQLDKKTFKIK